MCLAKVTTSSNSLIPQINNTSFLLVTPKYTAYLKLTNFYRLLEPIIVARGIEYSD